MISNPSWFRHRFRLRARITTLASLGVALLASDPLDAQEATEVRFVACADCRITLDQVARLSGGRANEIVSQPGALAVLEPGRIYFGSVQTRGELFEFRTRDNTVHVHGRTGSGPGELQWITQVVAAQGDTLLVLDDIARVMNRLTGDGKFIDRTLLPGGINHVIPLGGRRMFVNARIPSRLTIGYPLHIVDSMGVVASFGDELTSVDATTAGHLYRLLAPGPQRSVWVGHWRSYRIERWTETGRLLSVMTRRAPWFPPAPGLPTNAQMSRPVPRMAGLDDSGDGLLWVYVHLPPRDWRPAPLVQREGRQVPASSVLHPYLDTMIEVIDQGRSVAVASFRSPRALFPIGGGYLAAYDEDSQGNPSYTIYRPRLTGSIRQP